MHLIPTAYTVNRSIWATGHNRVTLSAFPYRRRRSAAKKTKAMTDEMIKRATTDSEMLTFFVASPDIQFTSSHLFQLAVSNISTENSAILHQKRLLRCLARKFPGTSQRTRRYEAAQQAENRIRNAINSCGPFRLLWLGYLSVDPINELLCRRPRLGTDVEWYKDRVFRRPGCIWRRIVPNDEPSYT